MFLIVFLGLAVTSSLFTAVCSQSYPSSVLVPSTFINNTDVSLSCTGAAPVQWRVNGTLYDSRNPPPRLFLMGDGNGSMIIQQTLTVEQAFILTYNGTAFQCSTNGDDFSIVPTALIIVYSPPSEPVGLSSELSPVAGVLVLSWSPTWAPDGVQLHYTVTVTNTNSTSTTTITMFNTSSTTITISRDNITTSAGSSECDQYVWSVTAINPAGSSLPTNSTTPLSFVTAPDVTVLLSTIGSTLYIVIQAATNFSTTNVSVELVNSCTNESYPAKMLLLENNSWSFNITDLQNWTSITVVAENQCRSVSVPVNITALECPNTDLVVTTSIMPTAHTMTASSLPSSTATMTMTTTPLPVWGTALVVVCAVIILIALAVTIAIIVRLCLLRKKRGKTYSLKSASVLPKYADAHKVMGLLGRQQEGCSSAYGFFCKKKKNQSKTCSESSVELEGVVSSDKCPNKKTDMPIGLNILRGEVSSNISEDSAEGPKIASQGRDCPP